MAQACRHGVHENIIHEHDDAAFGWPLTGIGHGFDVVMGFWSRQRLQHHGPTTLS